MSRMVSMMVSKIKHSTSRITDLSPPKCWQSPILPQVKLNVDGNYIPPSYRMGVGGLIRDAVGKWRFGFFQHIGVGDPTVAEIVAIKVRFQYCRIMGFKDVVCESNN